MKNCWKLINSRLKLPQSRSVCSASARLIFCCSCCRCRHCPHYCCSRRCCCRRHRRLRRCCCSCCSIHTNLHAGNNFDEEAKLCFGVLHCSRDFQRSSTSSISIITSNVEEERGQGCNLPTAELIKISTNQRRPNNCWAHVGHNLNVILFQWSFYLSQLTRWGWLWTSSTQIQRNKFFKMKLYDWDSTSGKKVKWEMKKTSQRWIVCWVQIKIVQKLSLMIVQGFFEKRL